MEDGQYAKQIDKYIFIAENWPPYSWLIENNINLFIDASCQDMWGESQSIKLDIEHDMQGSLEKGSDLILEAIKRECNILVFGKCLWHCIFIILGYYIKHKSMDAPKAINEMQKIVEIPPQILENQSQLQQFCDFHILNLSIEPDQSNSELLEMILGLDENEKSSPPPINVKKRPHPVSPPTPPNHQAPAKQADKKSSQKPKTAKTPKKRALKKSATTTTTRKSTSKKPRTKLLDLIQAGILKVGDKLCFLGKEGVLKSNGEICFDQKSFKSPSKFTDHVHNVIGGYSKKTRANPWHSIRVSERTLHTYREEYHKKVGKENQSANRAYDSVDEDSYSQHNSSSSTPNDVSPLLRSFN